MKEPLSAATPIEFLGGIGPKRAEALAAELGVRTFGDLLYHLPFRYEDRTQFHTVDSLQASPVHVQLKGVIRSVKVTGVGRSERLSAEFHDETGRVSLVWFRGVKWIKRNLSEGLACVVWGKVSDFKGKLNMAHPELMSIQDADTMGGLHPVYSSTEKLGRLGLHSAGLGQAANRLVKKMQGQLGEDFLPEVLSEYVMRSRALPSLSEALVTVHSPASIDQEKRARDRLKFDELFFLQLLLLRRRLSQTEELEGVVFEKVGALFGAFYETCLPFELTGAQKRVIREIRADTRTGHHMNRLLQGDVGSGKTMVALMIALIAADNGFQTCLMAPTEILARQHFQGISEFLKNLPVRVELLTGSTSKAERTVLFEALARGEVHILIGTHAVLEPKVVFQSLGLVIIDEQHRFGVAQRAKLWAKATIAPHVLVMTATPIPRTLSMTLYGDLDVSVIDELPPGRQAIRTEQRTDAARLSVFEFLETQISIGRQVYVVYPLIEESATLDHKDLMDGYESLVRRFPLPKFCISVVHGRMKAEDKAWEMDRFVRGETHIMVATTVIEVGVNVPNATVMVVESAERFGLSQLHQLRGRVGRGGEQSYCILMAGKEPSREARKRLDTMCRTNDGFEISEVDLELRGPGDLMGTQQSGALDLQVADLVEDRSILEDARSLAREVLSKDPELESAENTGLRKGLERLQKNRADFSGIS
jgi:ATP-dependent DNA helicase RecG